MDKKCFKCGEIKNSNEFYVHKEMKDGYLGKCKECAKKDVRQLWIVNINEKREKERERYKRRKLNKEYLSKKLKRDTLWKKRNPGCNIAHNEVHRKLINPGICSLCGSVKFVQGHHMDYSKPLEVIWCCAPCHHKFRKNLNKTIR